MTLRMKSIQNKLMTFKILIIKYKKLCQKTCKENKMNQKLDQNSMKLWVIIIKKKN